MNRRRLSHVLSYRQKMERTEAVKQLPLPTELNLIILDYLFCCELCLPDRGFCSRFRYCKTANSQVYDGVNTKSPITRTKTTREAIVKRINELETLLNEGS